MAPNIKYNRHDNILSLRFSKNKIIDSDIRGNVVMDFDKNGDIVNVDIMKIDIDNFVPLKKMRELSIHCDKVLMRA